MKRIISICRVSRKGLRLLLILTLSTWVPFVSCGELPCRPEDPSCSESSFLTLWSLLAPDYALYYGNSLDQGFYRMDLEEQTPVNLFTTANAVERLGFNSTGQTLWFISNNGRDLSRVMPDDGNVTFLKNYPSADYWGMHVLEDRNEIYLAENGSGDLQRTDLQGNNVSNLVTPGTPGGLDIDTGDDQIYLLANNEIHRYNLDGSGYTLLVGGPTTGHDLEIEQSQQTMYWVDFPNGELRSANLDGTNNQLILAGLNGPRGLALDPTSDYIYYCNTGDQEIGRVRENGTNNTILRSNVGCADIDITQY